MSTINIKPRGKLKHSQLGLLLHETGNMGALVIASVLFMGGVLTNCAKPDNQASPSYQRYFDDLNPESRSASPLFYSPIPAAPTRRQYDEEDGRSASRRDVSYEESPYQAENRDPYIDTERYLGDLGGYTHYKSSNSFNFEGPHQLETINTNSYHKEVEPYEVSDFQGSDHYHKEEEKHAEVHYHQHKHVHKHNHKQEHHHKHKQEHKHDHGHKHEHKQEHQHKHENHHKHEHHNRHHHQHKADHHHKHEQKHHHKHHSDNHHDHKHKEEHKHSQHHGHKHSHHADHKHEHHEHNKHEHKHDHKHHNKHDHKHVDHHHHKHGHKHQAKHVYHHKHH